MIISLSIIKSIFTQLNLLLSVLFKLLFNLNLSLIPENLWTLFHNNTPVFVIDPVINNRYPNEKSSVFHIISRVT
jgi:hypothetical protein